MIDYRGKRCPSCFKSVCGRRENNGGRYLIFVVVGVVVFFCNSIVHWKRMSQSIYI